MAVYYEDITIVATRMAVLVGIIIFGIPGNIIAIIANVKSLVQNPLNGILYLHMGMVDFVLCFFHSVVALLLEGVGYFSLNNDLGEWKQFFRVLARDIDIKFYYGSSFISAMSLTCIAILRCWRIFNPFGIVRKKLLIGVICLFDIAIIVFAAFLKISDRQMIKEVSDSHAWKTTQSANGTDISVNFSRYGVLLERLPNSTDSGADNFTRMQHNVGVTKSGEFNFPMAFMTNAVIGCVTITALCYVLICLKLHKSRKEMGGVDAVQKRQFLKRQTRNLVTQVILFILFLSTQAPGIIQGYFVVSFALIRLTVSIGVINNAINPYVYCLLIPANRQTIQRLCSCARKNKTTYPR